MADLEHRNWPVPPPLRQRSAHFPWNPKHPLFDPVMELLCCLWRFPKRADELTVALELESQKQLSELIKTLEMRGFGIKTGRFQCGKRSKRRPQVQRRHVWICRGLEKADRAAVGYWNAVYENGEDGKEQH